MWLKRRPIRPQLNYTNFRMVMGRISEVIFLTAARQGRGGAADGSIRHAAFDN
jgi:hypothetical protein